MADSELPEQQADLSAVDLSGKTALVTGSTNGIGRAAALALGRLGATVLVHGRDRSAGQSAVAEIERTAGEARFLRADLADPAAVSRLAADTRDAVGTLDVLCNNAGGFFRDRGQTTLGVDRAFHVNHLAHFQLTAALLDAIPAGGRVVTTASVAHRLGALELDSLLDIAGLSPVRAYCRSKLANIQFASELARRLRRVDREVTSNAFHPGIIPDSDFGRALSGPVSGLFDLFSVAPVAETTADGAATLVYLAAAPAVADTTGSYFARRREIRPARPARDPETTRRLWEQTADILDIEEPLAPGAR
ncbi:MAG: dehydrogenase [halophilic archaeon J07HX64]|jgi:Dehydrogenases with different specificities (related to short-chain alcohol dehydrogenases)|nr:MAG: dehydrogenase [halophilic archaeon J07HX64]